MFARTRDWFRFRWQMAQGRQDFRQRGPLAAAEGMRYLNRFTEGALRHQRAPIYAIKNEVIRALYRQRYSTHVVRVYQVFQCWTCDGTGKYWDDWEQTSGECWKCGGTGIYRRVPLLRFTFDVGGREFIWHQPEATLDWQPFVWPTNLPLTTTKIKEPLYGGFRWAQAYRALGACYAFLERESLPAPQPTTLRTALRGDGREMIGPAYRWARHWYADVRWVLAQAHYLPPRKPFDWIPF